MGRRGSKAAAGAGEGSWSVHLTAPPEQKLRALELMQTAYMLLLANHGQLSSLQARQALDALNTGAELNLLRNFDHERSGQAASRFVEAQAYLRQGLEMLGVSAREQLQSQLHLVGKAEAIFDGLFDLVALKQLADNVDQNKALARNVADA